MSSNNGTFRVFAHRNVTRPRRGARQTNSKNSFALNPDDSPDFS